MATEITVTASTTVVLADTSNVTTIVYLPPLSNAGRQVQIRDETGYANVNAIIVSTTTGSRFVDNTNTAFIINPYSFLTVTQQADGSYAQTNSFNFPAGSGTVNAATFTTSTILFEDLGSNSTTYPFYSSNATLQFNNEPIGQVTPQVLTSTVNSLGSLGYLSSLNIGLAPIYVTVGVTSTQQIGIKSPVGSIQWSSNTGQTWSNANGGFATAGNDVAYYNGLFVAVGDGSDGASATTSNHIQTSTDGKNWTGTVVLGANQARNRVLQANGLWHTTGSNGATAGPSSILWSVNGSAWQASVSSLQFPVVANGIAYGNGVWVFAASNVSNAPLSLQYSTDGSNWISAASVSWTGTTAGDVIFDGAKFIALVAGGSNPNASNLAFSSNGSNWSSAGLTGGNLNFATNPQGALATILNSDTSLLTAYPATTVGSNQLVKTTVDGFTWLSTPTILGTYRISRPFYDGTVWWAGFQSQPIGTPPTYTGQGINRSLDNGRTWTNTGLTGGFLGGGFPNGFAILPGFSNFSFQLASTVVGLETQLTTNLLTVTGPPIVQNFWVASGIGTTTQGSLQYSADGFTWCNAVSGGFSGGGNLGQGIGYGNGVWVAVGNGGLDFPSAVQYSFDGRNWYPSASGINTSVNLQTVAYGNGRFIAGGSSNYTSVNGSNWTPLSTLQMPTVYSIAYNGYLWVAAGQATGGSPSTTLAYSYDTITWNFANQGGFSGGYGYGVGWNGVQWVAAGDDAAGVDPAKGSIQYSYDGSNWSNSVFGGFDYFGYNVSWNGTLWCAVGWNTIETGRIQHSTDGSNWFPSVTSTFSYYGTGIGTNGTQFVATGSDNEQSRRILVSTDGSNWQSTSTTNFTEGTVAAYTLNFTPDITTKNLNFYTNNQQTFLTSSHTIQTVTSNLLFDNTLYTNNFLTRAGIFVSTPSVEFEVAGISKTTTADTSNLIDNVQVIDSMTMQGPLNASNLYVATGASNASGSQSNQCLKWSYDGVTWNNNVSGGFIFSFTSPFYAIASNIWVTTGLHPSNTSNNALGIVQWSIDGSNWNPAVSGNFQGRQGTNISALAFASSNFIFQATSPGNQGIYFSQDGKNWQPSSNISLISNVFFPSPTNNSQGFGVSYMSNIGATVTIGSSDSYTYAYEFIYYSTDNGSNFRTVISNVDTGEASFIPFALASSRTKTLIFGVTGGGGTINRILASTDGSNFVKITTDYSAPVPTGAAGLFYAGGIWFATQQGGYANKLYYSSNDGSNWYGVTNATISPTFAEGTCSVNYDGNLWYMGGANGYIYASSNLSNWTATTSSKLYNEFAVCLTSAFGNATVLNKIITNSVGVGNNNPQYALDITGQLRVTSTILAQAGVLSNGVYLTSDSNVKEDIQRANLSICYSTIQSLDLKRFSFISPIAETKQDKTQLGFLAQDIATRFPKSVTLFDSILHFMPDQVFYAAYGATQALLSTVEYHSTALATIQATLEELDHCVP